MVGQAVCPDKRIWPLPLDQERVEHLTNGAAAARGWRLDHGAAARVERGAGEGGGRRVRANAACFATLPHFGMQPSMPQRR